MTGSGTVPIMRPSVVVSVLTYRRTEQLAGMLPAVLEQVESLVPPAQLLVIDNDPEASAQDAVGRFEGRVRYEHEPEPGIAAARNRAIVEAADADALVFLDDDETPASGWLQTLVTAWQETGADAVTGPVVSQLDGAVDPWVRASGHFDMWQFGDREVVPAAATNNLLLDLRTLRRLHLRFDPSFGLTGGSDSRLTRELVGRGGEIRWAQDAVVTEFVPAERATKAWVCQRITRTANGWARIRLDLADTAAERSRIRLALSLRALAIMGRGVASGSRGVMTNSLAARARGRCEIARGRGVLIGLWGVHVVEYGRSK